MKSKNQVNFPDELTLWYAVCRRDCGNKEFIVDDSDQVCRKCGHSLFRVCSKTYVKDAPSKCDPKNTVAKDRKKIELHINEDDVVKYYDIDIDESAVVFPEAVNIAAARCSEYPSGAYSFIVDGGSSQICGDCGKVMRRYGAYTYKLKK